MGISSHNAFDTLQGNLPLNEIQKILKLPISDEEKQLVMTYVICKKLENTTLTFPKKSHKRIFADYLLSKGVEEKAIVTNLEISQKTVKRIKKEVV